MAAAAAHLLALSQDGWLQLQILLQLMIHLKWPLLNCDLSSLAARFFTRVLGAGKVGAK